MNPEKEYFSEVIDKCCGCEHITNMNYCGVYLRPERHWTRIGGCAMRTHNKAGVARGDFKLNPLKASKRGTK